MQLIAEHIAKYCPDLSYKYRGDMVYVRLPHIVQDKCHMWHLYLSLWHLKDVHKQENNKIKNVPLWLFGPHLHIDCGTRAKIIEDPWSM